MRLEIFLQLFSFFATLFVLQIAILLLKLNPNYISIVFLKRGFLLSFDKTKSCLVAEKECKRYILCRKISLARRPSTR